MASLRKRSNGKYSLDFRWKGKAHIKALGTDNEQEAEQIKKDAEDQLARIRRGESALASRLLAEGFSILDVLFGCPEIASRLTIPVAMTAGSKGDSPSGSSGKSREARVHSARPTNAFMVSPAIIPQDEGSSLWER